MTTIARTEVPAITPSTTRFTSSFAFEDLTVTGSEAAENGAKSFPKLSIGAMRKWTFSEEVKWSTVAVEGPLSFGGLRRDHISAEMLEMEVRYERFVFEEGGNCIMGEIRFVENYQCSLRKVTQWEKPREGESRK